MKTSSKAKSLVTIAGFVSASLVTSSMLAVQAVVHMEQEDIKQVILG